MKMLKGGQWLPVKLTTDKQTFGFEIFADQTVTMCVADRASDRSVNVRIECEGASYQRNVQLAELVMTLPKGLYAFTVKTLGGVTPATVGIWINPPRPQPKPRVRK